MPTAAADACPNCGLLRRQVAGLKAQLAVAVRTPATRPSRLPVISSNHRDRIPPEAVATTGRVAVIRGLRFEPHEIDQAWEYTLDECPDCGGRLQDVDVDLDIAPRMIQQVEIVQRPICIEEHCSLPHWCPKCQRVHYAPFPPSVVKSGLVGPRLTALVGYLRRASRLFPTIRKFLRDVVGTDQPRATGQAGAKVSASLRETYEQLPDALHPTPSG